MLRGPFRVDDARHRYFIGAQRVPGVRGILRTAGIEGDKSFLSPEYQARGKAVHDATLHFDLTGRDVDWLPDDWDVFFRAYVRFRAAIPCKWKLLETAKPHRTLRYASRVDRMGLVNGYPALVELKTGGPDAFHGPQLAGLDLLLGRGTRRRLGVYLFKTGKFRVIEYSDPKDYMTFLAALNRYWQVYPYGEDHDRAA